MNAILIFIGIFVSYVTCYTPLNAIPGYESCYLIKTEDSGYTEVYNCSGSITIYSDDSDVDDDYQEYSYPANAKFNPSIRGFAFEGYYPEINDDTTIPKKTDILCFKRISSGVCNLITSFIQWAAKYAAKYAEKAKALKDMGSACRTKTELVRHNGSGSLIHITAFQNEVTGNNCDTTAQRETIFGAIQDMLEDKSKLCGSWCAVLNHGGDWDGYVSFGVTVDAPNIGACRDANLWKGTCTSVHRL